MLKEMRRKEKQLTTEETIAILNKGEYGILSTIGSDGNPYGVPINYVYHENIYFHGTTAGHKLDNIENNCNVSFCVVIDVELLPSEFNTKFKSVIVFGKAKEVFEQEKKVALHALLQRFSSEYIEAGVRYIEKTWEKTRVFKIEIEHMTSKGKK